MSFRIVKILPVCLAVASLAGCGNPDYGKEFRPGGKPASQAASTEPAAQQAAVAPEAWGPCKTMYVYSGTGAAYSSELANSKACPGVANKSAARLKVSAYFPTTRRACLVPLNSGAAYPATCFTIGPARRPRKAMISMPVSMPTGHAVAHRPQAAQVSRPW